MESLETQLKNLYSQLQQKDIEITNLKKQIAPHTRSNILNFDSLMSGSFKQDKSYNKNSAENHDAFEKEINKRISVEIQSREKKFNEKIKEIQSKYEKELTTSRNMYETLANKVDSVVALERTMEAMAKDIKILEDEKKNMKLLHMEIIKQNLIESELKFSDVKKKMIEKVKEVQKNVSLNYLEQMNNSQKLTFLRNNQLEKEIDYRSVRMEELILKNEKFENRIFVLTQEIDLLKKTQDSLIDKNQKYSDVIRNLTAMLMKNVKNHEKEFEGLLHKINNENISINNSPKINNFNNSPKKKELEKDDDSKDGNIYNGNNNNNLSDREKNINLNANIINKFSSIGSLTNKNIKTTFSVDIEKNINLSTKNNLNRVNYKNNKKFFNIPEKINSNKNDMDNKFNRKNFYNSTGIIFPKHSNKEEENETLSNTSNFIYENKIKKLEKNLIKKEIEYFKIKKDFENINEILQKYQKKFMGVISLYEIGLKKLLEDNESIRSLKEVDINFDFENLKNFEFENLNNEKKYYLLVILLKNILPLVNVNELESGFIKENVVNFKIKYFEENLKNNLVKDNFFRNSVSTVLANRTLNGKKIETKFYPKIRSTLKYLEDEKYSLRRKLDVYQFQAVDF